MKSMKKWLIILMAAVLAFMLTACSGGDKKEAAPAEKKEETAAAPAEQKEEPAAATEEKKEEPAAASAATGNPLVDNYGFQWTDPTAPILNEQGAKELSFRDRRFEERLAHEQVPDA